MKISTYAHGIYPRSEALVAATRDHERGRTPAGVVADQVKIDTEEFVNLQVEVGLDYISDGLFTWQDIFRPMAMAASGMEPGPLVRWFDNNAFFRAPVVSEDVKAEGVPPGLAGDLPKEKGSVATLPSPFMFSRAALGDFEPDKFMREVAEDVIAPSVSALSGLGYDIIQLQDPWLGFYGLGDGSWEEIKSAVASIKAASGDVKLHFHVYFGDAAPLMEGLRDLPIDALGVDFIETDVLSLGEELPFGLMAGCINGRSSNLESAGSVADFVSRLAESVKTDSLFVSSNSALELLPAKVANQKVATLGEVGDLLRDAS